MTVMRTAFLISVLSSALLVSRHCSTAFITSSQSATNGLPMIRTKTPLAVATADEQLSTGRILNNIQQEHDKEVSRGFAVWDRSKGGREWADEDFVSRSVGSGNAGPDERFLEHGDQIFETVQPVLSKEECDSLVTEARQVIAQGLEKEGTMEGGRNVKPTNSQLGEARLSQMPEARKWLREALQERFFPLLESRFGVPADELTLNDALIIGYGYFGGKSPSQPVHRDADLLSLNVALSPRTAFQGGGTYFEGLPADSSVVTIDQGHVLCHSGGAPHAGRGIMSGERWVLVLFSVAENLPQMARRCHAKGCRDRDGGDFGEAETSFRAGLSFAPQDHLLLSSLGSVFMAQGKQSIAQNYLAATANSYDHCQKANLGLARMFLAGRKPRAALRRFDAVLDYLNDRDLSADAWAPLRAMGWDARVYGSQAAIICAQEADRSGRSFDASLHLNRATKRLQIALTAVPGDERIISMLQHVDVLQSRLS